MTTVSCVVACCAMAMAGCFAGFVLGFASTKRIRNQIHRDGYVEGVEKIAWSIRRTCRKQSGTSGVEVYEVSVNGLERLVDQLCRPEVKW